MDVHRFAPTLPMPTYLMAFMVGPSWGSTASLLLAQPVNAALIEMRMQSG